VVMRGLQTDPNRRFRDAREMALALEAIADAERAPSVRAFADSVLGAHRTAHSARLRSWLSGQPLPSTPPSRTTAPGTAVPPRVTVQAETAEPVATVVATQVSNVITEPGPTAVVQRPELPARPLRMGVLAIAGALIGAGAVALIMQRAPAPAFTPAAPAPTVPVTSVISPSVAREGDEVTPAITSSEAGTRMSRAERRRPTSRPRRDAARKPPPTKTAAPEGIIESW
jgi:hypothetical protein